MIPNAHGLAMDLGFAEIYFCQIDGGMGILGVIKWCFKYAGSRYILICLVSVSTELGSYVIRGTRKAVDHEFVHRATRRGAEAKPRASRDTLYLALATCTAFAFASSNSRKDKDAVTSKGF